LKLELKALQTRLEFEQKKREEAEKQLKEKEQEVITLRKKLGGNAQAEPANSLLKPNSAVPKKVMALKEQGRSDNRNSVRRSVMKPDAKKITDMLSLMLEQMRKLEARMKEAEDARVLAESEVEELAIYKQNSDETITTIVNQVNTIMDTKFQAVLTSLNNLINKTADATLKANLSTIKSDLTKLRIELDSNIARQVAANNIQFSLPYSSTSTTGGAPPPPSPSSIPAPPVLPALLLAPAPVSARTSTLLDQIRRGKNLKQLDLDLVKKEREERNKTSRQSLNILTSLQETLRAALQARQDDMMLYEDDDDDEYAE